MLIMDCNYNPGFQQIAFVDTETGELSERRLELLDRLNSTIPELNQVIEQEVEKYPAAQRLHPPPATPIMYNVVRP